MFIKSSMDTSVVKGAAGGRSKINGKGGRVTRGEVFPFPEVNAKNGHEARNKYFPSRCRYCAISPLGRGV